VAQSQPYTKSPDQKQAEKNTGNESLLKMLSNLIPTPNAVIDVNQIQLKTPGRPNAKTKTPRNKSAQDACQRNPS